MRLRITYGRVADFLADVRTQVARGGLLVRVDPGAADRGAPVELEVVTPAGRAQVAARVLQVLAGAGVAVELDPGALAQLAAAAEAQKIQQALHGDKHQRMAILREPNKMLHGYVLRNPQLQLDEVVFIARMTTVSTDLLTFIAGRREWAERPEVAIALVRNPK